MAFSGLSDVELWHVWAAAAVVALVPIFRALAVVIVARTVNPNLAKLAIPLILRSSFPRVLRLAKRLRRKGRAHRVALQ